MMITIDDIEARAATVCEAADPRSAGLLFHGTCEPFDGPLKPGGDGVLWFADNPLIAQTYIPECGLTSIVGLPADWKLKERVKPDKHSFWTEFAVGHMNRTLPDVEYDAFGQAKSWSILPDWPTYGDCVTVLRELGYSFGRGFDNIKQPFMDGGRVVRPADWLQPGRVFVTAADGFKFFDMACGEGDLTDPSHVKIGAFMGAEKAGYDGVIIDDFAQSSDYGNVGHRSVGVFASAAKRLNFAVFDAVHRQMDKRHLSTEDFQMWAETLRQPAMAI